MDSKIPTTRSGRIPTNKLDSINQLVNSASDFKPIHRRSFNINFVGIAQPELTHIFAPLKDKNDIPLHMYVGNLTKEELMIIHRNKSIMNRLQNEDEKTLALYLNEVILNDP